MRFRHFLFLLFTSTLCLAAQPDRIAGTLSSSQMVPLRGNVHGLARAAFDQGRADGSRLLSGVSLVFKPSAAQKTALNKLLAQQQDPTSPNYHKWLTPAQFADRFGMSQNDLDKVASWLQSQGLTVTRTANSRNQIFFEGTVAQVEAAFRIEMHNYLVDGELHYANAGEPSIPSALSGVVLAVHNLHNFQPKPRAIFRKMSSEADPRLTSYVTGNHFVTPGDFATIYDVQPLYTGGTDGTGQKIALTGQSSINLADVATFRSLSGLSANVPTLLLEPGTGTSTRCPGDEGESDLDVEWSGAVAKNASITLVYAGLVTGDTCTNRTFGAFDALQYAIDQKIAPVISNSYGNCESAIGLTEAQTMQGWIQQANTQGQTVMSASGDSGAADCDPNSTDPSGKSATGGLAVDLPAAIPEVTGMGGTEFTGDPAGTVTNGNASATTYWSGTTGGTDTISSALSYIPETSWNDTVADGSLSASGGGTSIFFAKPSWQPSTGAMRDAPDLALNASPDHDPYLMCSEDGASGAIVPSCTSGFRTGSGGDFTAVGGTSAAAPTFSGIVALLNQYLGTSGLGNINPNLYSLVTSNPTAFHDITTGNNIVPCTNPSPNCPTTAPFQYGFSAGAGYDQVTGLGSVDAHALVLAWAASEVPDFQLSAGTLNPAPVSAGQSASALVTLSAITGSTGRVVNFSPSSCSGLPTGATCSFNPASVTFDGTNPITTTVTIATNPTMAVPKGAQTITITPSNSPVTTATLSLTVTATTESFTLSSSAATFPIGVGGTAKIPITVTGTNGFVDTSTTPPTTVVPLTYSCSGIPTTAEISCQVPNNGQPTNLSSVTINLVTTPVTTGRLRSPLGRSPIFYAALLPGLFGVVFLRSGTRGMRFLGLIVLLGFSTLWLGACGGSSNSNSSLTNPGTPPGNYVVTISATTGGAVPLTNTSPPTPPNPPFTITLKVSSQ